MYLYVYLFQATGNESSPPSLPSIIGPDSLSTAALETISPWNIITTAVSISISPMYKLSVALDYGVIMNTNVLMAACDAVSNMQQVKV